MARGGINKAVVKSARTALQARGVHPSIDAVRVQLGNTGSKSTIQRYLKELTAEETHQAPVALTDELSHLISMVAERLNEETRLELADDQARVEEAWGRHTQAQAQQRELVDALQHQIRRQEVQLDESRQREHALHTELDELQALHATHAQGLYDVRQALDQREVRNQSLSERCEHLKAALEHYREQQRAQREQELERHDQQMQQLARELRVAQTSLLQKQEELTALYRDHERLLTEHRLATRQAHTELTLHAQAKHGWERLSESYEQRDREGKAKEVEWQLEISQLKAEHSNLRSRLRAALLQQRSDAQSLRKAHQRFDHLQRLLVTKNAPSPP